MDSPLREEKGTAAASLLHWQEVETGLQLQSFLHAHRCTAYVGCSDRHSVSSGFWCAGVEMEALTAVSVAALTVYDMCKAVTKDISIGYIRLRDKSGGASGDYVWRGTHD